MSPLDKLRPWTLAGVMRLYPFMSGGARLANSSIAKSIAGDPGPRWAQVDGGKALVPLNDLGGRSIYLTGDLDRRLSWVIDKVVQPGDIALDIGANLGLVTLKLAACVGNGGQVHSFEPNPQMLAFLEQTLERNRLEQISLHPIALGEEEGTLPLYVNPDNAGASSLLAPETNGQNTKINVPIKRLSDYASKIGLKDIDFIKIDVEGFEASVFRGALALLEATTPGIILLEEHASVDNSGLPPSLRILKSLDYDLYAIKDQVLFSIKLLGEDDPGFASCADYVAIHKRAKKAARVLGVG